MSTTTLYKLFKKGYNDPNYKNIWQDTRNDYKKRQDLINRYVCKIFDPNIQLIKGQKCLYINRSKKIMNATITNIDQSIVPFSYEIQLDNDKSYINTERNRICFYN